MGLCSSKSQHGEDDKNKQIQKELNEDWKKQNSIVKLLLLGAGESGKSTIFKQMKILYGKSWEKEELDAIRIVIYGNIVQNMKAVLDYMKLANIESSDSSLFKELLHVPDDAFIDSTLATKIKTMWNDEGVQTAWKERSKFQVLDCLEYYCEDIDRIGKSDYVPTEMDILHSRVRTSGIVEETYIIDKVTFMMYDVGGQRNERKKWIHCFDNVTAVIFVAAMNEYDQVLYEDSQTNRIDEALKLFEEICNSSWFRKTSMILFLNKKDLFEEKLFKIPFRVPGVRYDDFQGPYANVPGVSKEEAVEAAHQYILSLFEKQNQLSDKEIYSHVTCATDTRNVEVVFGATRDIILRRNLVNSGFMD